METLKTLTLLAWMVTQSALAQTTNEQPPVALLPSDNKVEVKIDAMTGDAAKVATPAPNANQSALEASQPSSPKPSAPWNEYAKIENMAQNGQANEALALLETRLKDAPDDAKASYLKGLILMQLGRREQAEEWFLGMRKNFPNLPQPYNALAVIYQAQGKLIEAELILRELSQAHPEQKNVHRNRGEIYLQLAQSAFEKANQQNPEDAMIKTRLEQLKPLLSPQK